MEPDAVLAHWNEQAGRGRQAGSRDVIAAELERRAILAHLGDGMKVLDVGCGTGETAIAARLAYQCDVTGWDYASAMIDKARDNAAMYAITHGLRFEQVDIRQIPPTGQYDAIYTQRCIINVGDWKKQRETIYKILVMLKPGGMYLMCECSADGLEEVNELRAAVGLPAIVAPWHNRYLVESELDGLAYSLAHESIGYIEAVEYPLSTYALLSRVVNAALAQQADTQPAYDAAINQLALSLPAIGTLGQNRLWRWRRL